ncbi:MAG: manganese efflux pump [Candidatus Saccharibacteria bacterium]
MLAQLIGLTIPLCLDSFLIAAAIGMSRPSKANRIRISTFFAVFEAGMPLVGLLIGEALSGPLGGAAEYTAIVVLIIFGLYATFNSKDEDDDAKRIASTHGLAIIGLGLGISLDGLAIGFTYGLLHLPVVLVTTLIAIQAFVLSQVGFAVGGKLPERIRQYGEKVASLALIAIGVLLFIQKITQHA